MLIQCREQKNAGAMGIYIYWYKVVALEMRKRRIAYIVVGYQVDKKEARR